MSSGQPAKRSKPAAAEGQAQASNTLHLDSADLERYLTGMEAKGAARARDSLRRAHTRWPYRMASIRVTFVHPGGTKSQLTMAARNLSAGGICLLHRAFVHHGTRCVVHLADLQSRVVEAGGVVVWCQHVEGSVHEIGVRFDAPIRTREFIRLDRSTENAGRTNADPRALNENVVYSAAHEPTDSGGPSPVNYWLYQGGPDNLSCLGVER